MPESLHEPAYKSLPQQSQEDAAGHDHNDDDDDDEQSANDDINYLSVSNVKITPNTFMSMCPALLAQIEQGSCTKHVEVEKRHSEMNHFGK